MSQDRPRWWSELLLIIVAYGAYSGARLLARGDIDTAVDNGLAILKLERALWLHPEVPLNELFTQQAWLGVPSSFAYASLHYIVTPAILIWLYRRRPLHYRLMRTWLLSATLLGLVGFTLLPTCPPRLLPGGEGFVDSLAQYSQYGWWADDASAPSGMGDFTNQFAAMPSLHVGWSLWCGVALWHYGSRSLWVRSLALAYPLATTMVVMGTANHYFMDAVAGVAVMTIGLLLARPLLRLSGRVQDRFGARRAVPGTEHDRLAGAPSGAAVSRRAPRDPAVREPARQNGPARQQLAPPS
ncbi:phosphatase PAP2 family protein [Streptomyces sp. RFCAC02]|uniref:phosphatase PAP2 family protein n=1 Tax=Streptomyces sp. RFCAC02 TaxID=2499143 RepID=UPI00101F175C|nr:phosphatase PAP2 family protein [Streptomyces sp. RFCAC02]